MFNRNKKLKVISITGITSRFKIHQHTQYINMCRRNPVGVDISEVTLKVMEELL